MNQVVIDGWHLYVDGAGCRVAKPPTQFESLSFDEHGLYTGGYGDRIPPAVLAWLIRPLLHDAWDEGGECDGSNPYTDEPKP